jgi:hypothetical protein
MSNKILVTIQQRKDSEDVTCYEVVANNQGCPPLFKHQFYDQKEGLTAKEQAIDCIKSIELEGESFFDRFKKKHKK